MSKVKYKKPNHDSDDRGRKLNEKEKYVYDLIIKGHNYYNGQDKKYKWIVRVLKILVLLVSLISTIILGLSGVLEPVIQINAGLVLSAIITFITALSAYFNFERYWMRNIKTHIKFNILRDSFVYEAKSNKDIPDERLTYYFEELKKIQEDNIVYWKKAIDKAE